MSTTGKTYKVWRCTKCDRRFAYPHQDHGCGFPAYVPVIQERAAPCRTCGGSHPTPEHRTF